VAQKPRPALGQQDTDLHAGRIGIAGVTKAIIIGIVLGAVGHRQAVVGILCNRTGENYRRSGQKSCQPPEKGRTVGTNIFFHALYFLFMFLDGTIRR